MLEMESNPLVAELWKWSDHLTRLIDSSEGFVKPESSGEPPRTKLIGVRHILDRLQSVKYLVDWQGVGAENLSPLVHYQSEER